MLLCFRGSLGIYMLLMFTVSIYGQSEIDSTSRPAVYYPMLEAFEIHSISEGDIVFLGNSITFWADWPVLLGDCEVKNRGIPGDNTFGIKERLYEVTRNKPAKIFIMIGINDLARNIPDSIILKNYKEILNQIQNRSPKTKIYIQTLLPTNEDFGKLSNHYHRDENIRHINSQLKQMGKESNITVIDLYQYFADEGGKLLSEFTWDGVHLTIEGYLQWVDILKKGDFLKLLRED